MRTITGYLAILLSFVCTTLDVVHAIDVDEFDVYVTTYDQKKLLSHEGSVRTSHGTQGFSVWVNTDDRYQSVVGFGAAITSSSAYLLYHSPKRNEMMQEIFGPNGMNTHMIRLPIGSSDLNAETPYTYDDMSSGDDFNMTHFSIEKDKKYIIPIIKQALQINPKLKICGSPWSAPDWMKQPRGLFGGEFKSDGRYQEALAKYLTRFIQAYAAEGIPIHYLTVQNEPLLSLSGYSTMVMKADIQKALLRDHLCPKFKAAGISTRILVYDFNWRGSWYPDQVLSDGNVRNCVDGIAWHGYDGDQGVQSHLHDKYPEKSHFMTEFSGGGWEHFDWKGSLRNLLRVQLIGGVKNWDSGVMLWNMVLDNNHGPRVNVHGCDTCRPIITTDYGSDTYTKNVDYYALAHFGRFVKQGAVRVNTASFGWDDLQATAFVNPDGKVVVIVLNPHWQKTAQFSIDIAGRNFHYSLPLQSVATFVMKN